MPTASGAPALDAPLARGMRARVVWRLLRMLGWRVTLATPVPMKCVIVFYPHTSNWDFPSGLLAKWVLGIVFRWVGKDTMFASPLTPFRRWGGIRSTGGRIRLRRADARGNGGARRLRSRDRA